MSASATTSSAASNRENSGPSAAFASQQSASRGSNHATPSWLPPGPVFAAQIAASQEILDFASKRMRAQADFIESLSHCDNLEQATSRHREFLAAAGQQYSEEMSQLMGLVHKNLSAITDVAITPPAALQTH